MFEYFVKKLSKDNRGFTLIELVVVIAILGILSAIAVPKYNKSRLNAAVSAHNANVKTIESAATMYLADGGSDITSETAIIAGQGVGEYLQEVPTVPKEAKVTNDADVYKITIVDGKITVTPGLRKVDNGKPAKVGTN